MALSKVMYTARVTVTGGRDGEAVSEDGRLRLKMVPPKEMGGDGGEGTNPEQLFAAGYAACFLSAMKMVAGKRGIQISAEPSVTAAVGIGPHGKGFGLQAELTVRLPGMDEAAAKALADEAHQVCPYSNATRNNIDVTITVKTGA